MDDRVFSKQNSLSNCAFIKTILMILIILYHSCVYWTGTWFDRAPVYDSQALSFFAKWLNSFHIYTFVLVSGYIFAFKISRGHYNSFFPFITTKVKRLLVPYVFLMVVWVAPISAFLLNWDRVYLFKKYILCIEPSQLWFLWMLFGVFLIIWPIRKLMIEKPLVGCIIALIFYVFGILIKRFIPNVFCIWTAFQYIPFFSLGMKIRVKQEKGEKPIMEFVPWILWMVVDLIIFTCMMVIGQRSGTIWNLMTMSLNLLLHIVGAIMAWSVLQMIAGKVKWKENRVFKIMSAYSMPMYLFHQQIIYFVIFWLNGKINPWINAGINFVIAVAGSFMISALLMKWKVTRVLIGEKP